MSLLKILLTNFCIYDCQYCVNRISSDIAARALHASRKSCELTLDFYRRNYIEGLFLSSGVIQSARLHDGAAGRGRAAAARGPRLRRLHPPEGRAGRRRSCWRAAGRYADRLSANIELPTQADLRRGSRRRRRTTQIERAMSAAARRHRRRRTREARARARRRAFAPAGQSTQMIVGATTSTDGAILDDGVALYDAAEASPRLLLRLQPDSRRPMRCCRQAARRSCASTGFTRRTGCCASTASRVDELTTTRRAEPRPATSIPKLAWALRHRRSFPVDLNTRRAKMLLRMPGLGQRSVERILRARRLAQRLSLKRSANPACQADAGAGRSSSRLTGGPSHAAAADPPRASLKQPLLWAHVAVSVPDRRRIRRLAASRRARCSLAMFRRRRSTGSTPRIAATGCSADCLQSTAAAMTVAAGVAHGAAAISRRARGLRRITAIHGAGRSCIGWRYRLTHGERELLANDARPRRHRDRRR